MSKIGADLFFFHVPTTIYIYISYIKCLPYGHVGTYLLNLTDYEGRVLVIFLPSQF